MAQLLIRSGRLIDPASGRDEIVDILIEGDRIVEIGTIHPSPDAKVVDATGKLVIPGAIDLHVHLRDFEQAHKETIESGTMAALRGGVTTIFAMPNTKPPLDSEESIRRYQAIIQQKAVIETHVAGAITRGIKGQELAEIDRYPSLGIRMVTDDGCDVNNETLLEQAYSKAKANGLVLMTHPEMNSIAPDGVMNEGETSRKMGVPGQPNEKEWKAVERGIRLALKTGARAHFTHLSCSESIELVRQAKRKTDQITCDTTPHHLCLTDELVLALGGRAKVNPPLRTESDRRAMIEGVRDGTIDCIATDHAPHSQEEKERDVPSAAFGFTGLEILIPTMLNELLFNQGIDLMKVVELLTLGPAKIVGLESGRIQVGAPADLTIIDLNLKKQVRGVDLISKGKVTPFDGMTLRGWPVSTIFHGKAQINHHS